MICQSFAIEPKEFEAHTGWAIKPEGACKGEHCVPLPPEANNTDGTLALDVVATRLGMAVLIDEKSGLICVGPESGVTGRMLTTTQAPELVLPTFDGDTFALSSLRGSKVLLVAWASWCGCAHDLPVWQEVYEQVAPLGLEIVSVALDTAGADAGRPFVDRAQPGFTCLVDAAHSVGQKFGVTNVPTGIWIDEAGTIVRPAEPAFPGRVVIFEELAKADLAREAQTTGTQLTKMHEILKSDDDGLSPEVVERLEMTRQIAAATEPERYLSMVLDWAEHGSESRFALTPDEVIARSAPRPYEVSEAAAQFELGQHFERLGDHETAVLHWREAHRLQPLNWTYKRQAWRYEYGEGGDPSLYEGSMERDLKLVGPENYYPKLQD